MGWLFFPPKLQLLVFQVKRVNFIFGGKRYCKCFLMLTLVSVRNEMYLVPTWKNNGIPNFANRNSNLMSFQQRNYKKKSRPEYSESETELEFRFWWGSLKLEPKIGIPNLACPPTPPRCCTTWTCPLHGWWPKLATFQRRDSSLMVAATPQPQQHWTRINC